MKSLRDGSVVNIKYASGNMIVVTENMGLASELIQSIANYLNISKLEVRKFIVMQRLKPSEKEFEVGQTKLQVLIQLRYNAFRGTDEKALNSGRALNPVKSGKCEKA